MSKIGLFADVHIHPYSRFSGVTEDGLNTWVRRTLDVLRKVYDECATRNITQLYCLGDLFHTGPRLDTRTFNEVYRFFEWAKSVGFSTTLIAGNHDQLTRHGTESALYCFREVAHRVIEEPACLRGGSAAGYVVALLPYTEDYQAVRTFLAKYNPQVVLGHLAVQGAVVGRHEYQPKEGFNLDALNPEILTLLGHYHKQQTVASGVRYIGSVMAHDFNDANEQKGFTILDTETLETEFVPIESTSFKVFEDTPLQDSFIARGAYEGAIIRVDHSGDIDEDGVRKQLLERGAAAVTFKCITPHQVADRSAQPEDDPRSTVRRYVDENCGDLDGDRLYTLGTEIIQTVEIQG